MRLVFNKKGLSPVVAISLTIVIALVLAAIVFFWARGFVGEVLLKDLGGGPEQIDAACTELSFSASTDSGYLIIENTGNVPLYGVQMKKVAIGSTESKQILSQGTISKGESAQVTLTGASVGDEIEVVPVIIGQSQTGNAKKQHICINRGETITVS
jgi:flagellin-like protein